MNLADLLAMQYQQQEEILGALPLDRISQRQHARDLVLNLTEEIGEYLRSIAFKHWLASEERHRDLRVYELVDILKLVLALCWTEQVTADELSSHFAAKTAIARERMAARRQYGAKICAWDIDGVLAEDVRGCRMKRLLPAMALFPSCKAMLLQ